MNALVGTTSLVRLILRRDRILLPVWIVLTALAGMAIANSTTGLYKTAAERADFAAGAMASPAELFARGTVYSSSVGGLTAWTLGSSLLLIGGLISVLLLIRYTRVEEEAGRRELVGAAVVGRHAPLTAALLVVLGANLALGVLSALALIAAGQPAGGSFVFGLSAAGGGWVLAALAAVAGQLSEGAGVARAIALVGLGVLYLLRGLSDVTGSVWLSWLTPFGWARLTRAYDTDAWWVLSLLLLGTVALAAIAYALSVRRDVAGGLLPSRLGRPAASGWLTGSYALAWRLQRAQLIGWTVGFLVIGLLLGFASRGLDTQLDTPQLKAYALAVGGPGARISDVFFGVLLYVISQVVTAVAIVGALRTRSEEVAGRAEPLLAGPVGRLRWAAGHLVVALASPVIALLALGVGAGVSSGFTQLPRVVLSTLVYVPATWVLVGLAVALFGLLPRLAATLTWTVLGLFLLLDLLSEFKLVNDISYLSPFAATPGVLLSGGSSPLNLVWLTLIAAVLVAIGFARWRRRDVTS